ncbi:heme ABC exporter ATP-binding protein CcmA [Qipengyuania zhejiangensis]|uniref:heme ABC exporter ATP-binding protein CcmA n=1 Tax=Qipengyuania zhejiangensis TaxID=3077782 RepID=UPI002D797FBF|nr:heme ABC exporter ATP-binding protein CcmA [Qipengyuania sp. Z2]
MQANLAANDLACRRGDRLLFRGLSLQCGAGDAVHVAGPNGIGKSSLIRILAGLLRPFAGEIARTGSVGLIDERLALDPNQPLGKALDFWERLDGCGDPGRALEILQLHALMDIPVRYLSTGQKKRAAFARLLNGAPRIWLLDEPLNGLDAQAARSVEALVAQHCDAGGIAVVASHQPMALPGTHTLAIEDYAA